MDKHRFDFNEDYVLENEFVLLRPFNAEHAVELKSNSEDPKIWTYFLENGMGEKWEKYCLVAIRNRTIKKEYPFVIYDKIQN